MNFKSFAVVSAALLSASASFAAPCDTRGMRSVGSDAARELVVVNAVGDRSAHLYWINFQGQKVHYVTIPPRGRHVQPTYRGHVWVSENTYGYCDVMFTVENNLEIVIR